MIRVSQLATGRSDAQRASATTVTSVSDKLCRVFRVVNRPRRLSAAPVIPQKSPSPPPVDHVARKEQFHLRSFQST